MRSWVFLRRPIGSPGSPRRSRRTASVMLNSQLGSRRTLLSTHESGVAHTSLVSDLVLGCRLDQRHDLLKLVGQFGMGSQASVDASGQVGDAVGTRQAKPGGELAERDFAVAAAEPGSDGASDVGVSAMGQCRSVQAIVFRLRTEDGFGIASGKKSQRKVKPEGNRPARRSVT